MHISQEIYGKYLESAEDLVRNGYFPCDTDIHELANKIIESRVKAIKDGKLKEKLDITEEMI
jgi:hypothetical protein